MYALMADRDTLLEFRIGRAWGHHGPRGRNGEPQILRLAPIAIQARSVWLWMTDLNSSGEINVEKAETRREAPGSGW
jgi:hypothetical protein